MIYTLHCFTYILVKFDLHTTGRLSFFGCRMPLVLGTKIPHYDTERLKWIKLRNTEYTNLELQEFESESVLVSNMCMFARVKSLEAWVTKLASNWGDVQLDFEDLQGMDRKTPHLHWKRILAHLQIGRFVRVIQNATFWDIFRSS